MPTYDYQCRACGARIEIFHGISEAPKRKCPECGKLKLERKIGAGAAILFKGGGFYQTDYRSESYKQAAKAEQGGGESKGESKGDSKGEGKPEAPKGDGAQGATQGKKSAPKKE